MLLASAALTVALVVQGQTTLRAAPHDGAPRQTTLVPGDWLEVRGESQGYLQVYDHRHERPGYVRPSAVRRYAVEESSAPKLAAIVDFLKDAPGQESLGIGYVALYLRTAPAAAVGPEIFEVLGELAERLGHRASSNVAGATDGSTAAEIEVAESYGVHFAGVEHEGVTRLCYDGEAFRRVLALGGSPRARLHAALGLTEPSCLEPALGATATLAVVKWRAEVLEAAATSLDAEALVVPASEKARLRIRRSIVRSELAYFAARSGDKESAGQASDVAKHELQLVDRAVLADDDHAAYDEAALRAGANRWALETPGAPRSGVTLDVVAGAPGQTCIHVAARGQTIPFEHCTYGVVWPGSLRVAPNDAVVTLTVEPMEGWSELLVLHLGPSGWTADTLSPGLVDPDLGYAELAGFSPDGAHLLVVREWRASGPLGAPRTLAPWTKRTFQVLATSDLHLEKEVPNLASLPSSKRWETADWKRGTVALR